MASEMNYEFNQSLIENIILKLVDIYNIRISWEVKEGYVFIGSFALAGGVIGGIAGGKIAAGIGAGLGGLTGYSVSTVISLREVWQDLKNKLTELFYIVVNYLRRFDRNDYKRAFNLIMKCAKSRRELVMTIIDFLAEILKENIIYHDRYGNS